MKTLLKTLLVSWDFLSMYHLFSLVGPVINLSLIQKKRKKNLEIKALIGHLCRMPTDQGTILKNKKKKRERERESIKCLSYFSCTDFHGIAERKLLFLEILLLIN